MPLHLSSVLLSLALAADIYSLPLRTLAWFGWQSDGPGQCQAQSSPGMLSSFCGITLCRGERRCYKLSPHACNNGEKGVRSVPLDVRLDVFIPGFISSFFFASVATG